MVPIKYLSMHTKQSSGAGLKAQGSYINGATKPRIRKGKKRYKKTRIILAFGIFIIIIVAGTGMFGLIRSWTPQKLRNLPNTPWPMFHHDLSHTGLSPYETSSNDGKLKWKYKTGWGVASSPAIGSDGTIYVGSCDNYTYAINPDGTLKWKFKTGWYVYSSPAIGSDGTIYIGSYDHNLYAINPDGTKKWNFTTGGEIHSSPAIGDDGTIYIGSLDKNLYAINPDGTLKWNFSTEGYIYSSPAIGGDGTIYVGSYDHNLYAVYPNGTVKWKFQTWWYVKSSPAIGSDGTVYVGSDDDFLYAIGSQPIPELSPMDVGFVVPFIFIIPATVRKIIKM